MTRKKKPKNAIDSAIDLAKLNEIELVAQRNRIEEAVRMKIQEQFARIPWDHYINSVLAPFVAEECRKFCSKTFDVGGSVSSHLRKKILELAENYVAEHFEAHVSIKRKGNPS